MTELPQWYGQTSRQQPASGWDHLTGKVITIAPPGECTVRAGSATVQGAGIVRAQAPKRSRKPSLAAAIRQATKEGLKPSGATVAADGSVSLTFGEAQPEPKNDLDKWLVKRRAN